MDAINKVGYSGQLVNWIFLEGKVLKINAFGPVNLGQQIFMFIFFPWYCDIILLWHSSHFYRTPFRNELLGYFLCNTWSILVVKVYVSIKFIMRYNWKPWFCLKTYCKYKNKETLVNTF